ncbi:MAG: hypothetical protein QM760_22090 [Nibricoccus sp.]
MTTLALIDQVARWWDELTFAKQIFFGIGMIAGVVTLILAVLSLFGLEHHDASDALSADIDHGGGGIFSVKPLTGFFLGFGWVGGIALDNGWSLAAATGVALVSGGAILAVIVWMIRAIYSFRSDGTMRIAETVGAIGTVYLTLPAGKVEGGQVVVSFSGRQETFSALNAFRPSRAQR